MDYTSIPIEPKHIALVAHDNKKKELLEWAEYNRFVLAQHHLYATGTTGRLLDEVLGVEVTKLQSGPLGGDQQIGARIVEGRIDALVFFWDPLMPQPHDPDVKALLRVGVLHDIPIASNRATADLIAGGLAAVTGVLPPDVSAVPGGGRQPGGTDDPDDPR